MKNITSIRETTLWNELRRLERAAVLWYSMSIYRKRDLARNAAKAHKSRDGLAEGRDRSINRKLDGGFFGGLIWQGQ